MTLQQRANRNDIPTHLRRHYGINPPYAKLRGLNSRWALRLAGKAPAAT